MKTQIFTTLAFLTLVAGCGQSPNNPESQSAADTVALKKAAAESIASGASGTVDPCMSKAWYGDGTCDSFCPSVDTDCSPVPNTVVVCAQFIEAADGKCSRLTSDPCRFQDPDCASTGGTTEPKPSGQGPSVCAMIVQSPDGKCTLLPNDPCQFQDPDCGSAGTVCTMIVQVADGVCSLPVTDPCQFQDPDCVGGGTACDLLLQTPDGVCSLPATDPCRAQDPDCTNPGGTGTADAGTGTADAGTITNPGACPAINCQPYCPDGVLLDSSGCPTCQCAPAPTTTSCNVDADCPALMLCKVCGDSCAARLCVSGTCQWVCPL